MKSSGAGFPSEADRAASADRYPGDRLGADQRCAAGHQDRSADAHRARDPLTTKESYRRHIRNPCWLLADARQEQCEPSRLDGESTQSNGVFATRTLGRSLGGLTRLGQYRLCGLGADRHRACRNRRHRCLGILAGIESSGFRGRRLRLLAQCRTVLQ